MRRAVKPKQQELLDIANREQAWAGHRPAIDKLGGLLPDLVLYLQWDRALARVVDPRTIELLLMIGRSQEMVFLLRIDLNPADGKPAFTFRGKHYRNPGQKYDLFDDVFRAIREALAAGTASLMSFDDQKR
jgi:hypothetical protein